MFYTFLFDYDDIVGLTVKSTMGYCFDIRLSDVVVTGEFEYPETAERFGSFCCGRSDKTHGIKIPECERKQWLSYGMALDAQFEFSCFTAAASDYLSEYNRGVMHAVAFRFRDRAFLLSAPSGVGKSTMIHSLEMLYPGEFSVICGDRPILSIQRDGEIFVEPSPWNGKENWFGADACRLGGVLFLSRGGESSLQELSHKEAALPVFNAWIQTLESEETIHRFAGLSTALIEAAPVWRFVSGGVPDSARFLYDTLLKEIEP